MLHDFLQYDEYDYNFLPPDRRFSDGDITEPVPFTTEEELKAMILVGGGGTSYHPIFSLLKEQFYPELPRVVLVFTDGYVGDWPAEEDALGVPVLWMISKGGGEYKDTTGEDD